MDDSLQITLVEKNKRQVSFTVIWNLFDFIICTAIVFNFMKLDIFHYKYFEQGEDVTKRCWWTPNIRSIHRMV